jgi:hypothetical protein
MLLSFFFSASVLYVVRVQPVTLRNKLETRRVYRGGEWMQVMGDHLNVP